MACDRTPGLGEDGVGVNVAASGEGVTAGFAEKMTPACCHAKLGPKLVRQCPVGRAVAICECRDHLLAGCRVRGVSDIWVASGEELLFLEFDPLPGWVADDAGEASCPTGRGVDASGTVADSKD